MRKREFAFRIFGLLVLAVMLCWLADANGQATDTYVGACAGQDACQLNQNGPVSWANGNQTWRFGAKYPSESIRIWILNRNTTSAHTSQTVQVFITDDSSVASLTSNADRWVQASVTDNTVANAKCTSVAANSPTSTPGANGKATCYVAGMYAIQIAVRITGANAQAGSPDTFDIGVVQQPSVNPGGPQPGSSGYAAASGPEIIGCIVNNGSVSIGNGLVSPFNCDGSGDVVIAGLNGSATGAQVLLTASAINLKTVTTSTGLTVEKGPRWSVTSGIQTGAAATATKAAGGLTVIHVADCIAYSVFATVAPAAASTDTLNILDGAAVLWEMDFTQIASISNTAQGQVCGLALPGTLNTAMSCKMTNATGNASHSCSLSGFDIQ